MPDKEQFDPNQTELFSEPIEVGTPKVTNLETDANRGINKPEQVEKKYFNHPEWCYQFFDDEPVAFAYPQTSGEPANKQALQIVLEPIESGGIFFSSKGMVFKIFPREISESSKVELQKTLDSKEKNPTE